MESNLPIEETRLRVLEEFASSRAALLRAIEGLSDEQMLERSIDKWSVKDHIAHIAHWDEMRFFEIRRISQGFRAAYIGMDDDHVEAFNELSSTLRGEFTLAQVRWELEFTRARVIEAIKQLTPAGADVRRYGEIGLSGGAGHEMRHAEMIASWRQENRL